MYILDIPIKQLKRFYMGRKEDYMATTSFDKSVVIEEPEAVDRLVDSLLNDEPRKVSENLLSEQDIERGERLLIQCLSLSNA